MKIGIVGCGTIGSEIALAISNNVLEGFTLAGICEVKEDKVHHLLARLGKSVPVLDLDALLEDVQLVLEATSKAAMPMIVTRAIDACKDVVVMSVGGFVDRLDLLDRAEKKRVRLYVPSGSLCGIDGVVAAKEAGLTRVILTTTKSPKSFRGTPYVVKNNLSLDNLPGPLKIFEGTARQANREFPGGFNLSITLSLAGIGLDRTEVHIVADPACHKTRHEIVAEGAFGFIKSITESETAPNNPHTAYLAILSAIATLRRIAAPVRIGT